VQKSYQTLFSAPRLSRTLFGNHGHRLKQPLRCHNSSPLRGNIYTLYRIRTLLLAQNNAERTYIAMFYFFYFTFFLFIPFVCNILTSWPATRLRCGLKREINANSRTHEFAKANLPKLTFWLTDMDKFELSNQWLLVDLPVDRINCPGFLASRSLEPSAWRNRQTGAENKIEHASCSPKIRRLWVPASDAGLGN